MTFTFRMRFSGLCVFVPERPFDQLGPEQDGSPGRVTVLLRNLLRPEPLKAASQSGAAPSEADGESAGSAKPDEVLSDPHFPLLEFDPRNRRASTSTRDADFTSHSSIFDGKSYCLLFGEDLNILPDGKPLTVGSVTTPPFTQTRKDSLAWVAQVSDISPAQGNIAAQFLTQEPDTKPAAESEYSMTSIIARVQLGQGRLTTSRLSDLECRIFPGRKPSSFNRRVAVELMLEIPGIEREVVLTMKRKNLGLPLGVHRLVLGPATEDSTDHVVEVQIHNREINGFIGVPLDYAEGLPVADFEVYYKLSSTLPADGAALATLQPLPPPLSPTAGSIPNGKCPPTAMQASRPGTLS